MTKTQSGKWIYWQFEEEMEVTLTEMYHVEEYDNKIDYVIGEKVFKHFQRGQTPVLCTGTDCDMCRKGNTASVRFRTSMFLPGDPNEYGAEINISLSRMLAEKQRTLEELDRNEEEILEQVYLIERMPKQTQPYWEVELVKEPEEEIDESFLDDLDDMEDEIALDDEDYKKLEKLSAKIQKELSQNPDFSWEIAARRTMEKRFKWHEDKIDIALEAFDGNGNIVVG